MAAGLLLSILSMPLIYGAAPGALRAAGISEESFGIPIIGAGVRDGLDYYLNPNRRGDRTAYDFGRQTLAALPADALVIAEWYVDTDEYFTFRYFGAVEGMRPDVDILGWPTVDPFAFDPALVIETVERALKTRPVYLASLDDRFYAVSTLAQRYCIVAEHNLYRIYSSPEAAAPACLDPARMGLEGY